MMDLFFDQEFRSLIPPLTPEEYQGLEASLVKEGNRDAIIIWKETKLLLDGHNRYDICHKHNISMKSPTELSFPDREVAMVWIIDTQLSRRNLPPYSRSVLALKKEAIFAEQARKRMLAGKKIDPPPMLAEGADVSETRDKVASLARVSHGTLEKVKVIEEKACFEDKAKLVAGNATINQVYTAIKRQEVKEAVKQMEWPSGKYRVIYADPPWQYDNETPDGSTMTHDYYPTKSLEDIMALPVDSLATENAVLFLWATAPMIQEALAVVKAWGFTYKAQFVWDKVKHNMGNYNSVRHELLLLGTKGTCMPDNNELIDSVQSIERQGHSEKPEEFRAIIGRLYPYGPRLELFGRKQVAGWEVYGNQIQE